jgi:hypothetical protein
MYEPELAEACDRFTRRVWPKTDERSSAPGAAQADSPPRVLFLREGEVIGHVATIPVRLAVEGRLRDASWAVGLMVVPEHRNGPVAPLLVKKLNETVDLGLTLHVEDAALRIFKGVGWRHLGLLPQYIRVLNARAFVDAFARRGQFLPQRWARLWAVGARASGLLAALVGTGFGVHAMTGALRRRRAGGTVVEERQFDASFTELAERVKGKLGVWVFRDQDYLTSRYGRRMAAHRLLACRAQGRLLGYCLVKLRQFDNDPRMGNIRMGTLIDLVFDPDQPDVLDALLASALAMCRRERVDVAFCTASLKIVGRHLWRHGFVGIPGTLHAAFHDRSGAAGLDAPLDAWHLMRGDSDADANC